jgi:hypothetical protein
MLHLRGGKVEPSDNSDCQAEHEGNCFAALGHSGDVTSLLSIASWEPELLSEASLVFAWSYTKFPKWKIGTLRLRQSANQTSKSAVVA